VLLNGGFMRKFGGYILFCILFLQSSACFSQKKVNVIVLPDPIFFAHHVGIETSMGLNSKLGILAAYKRDSNRPTYGKSNDDVKNNFSRIIIPWTYTKDGAWNDSFFITALIGLENDNYKSNLGSSAEVTFVNFGLLAGYQWYWDSGFNLSVMYGGAILVKSKLRKEVNVGEKNDVIDFFDKNTKSNKHGALGIIVGWVF